MTPDPFDPRVIRAAYDVAAEDYAVAFADELKDLPVDTAVLVSAIQRFPRLPVLDVGCGPGHVGEFLAARGVTVVGLDLSAEMLAVAQRRSRGTATLLVCADMRTLPARTRSCGGIVAFYSVPHVMRSELPSVLREFRRVLVDDGVLVLAMHLGEGEHRADEFLGHQIETVGGTFYGRSELEDAIVTAGFDLEDVRERGPLENEFPSQRLYVIAVTSRRRRPPARG